VRHGTVLNCGRRKQAESSSLRVLSCCEPDPDCLDPLTHIGVLCDLKLVLPLLGSGRRTVASPFGGSECKAIGRTLGSQLSNADDCASGGSCALLSSDAKPWYLRRARCSYNCERTNREKPRSIEMIN